jgi:hypothetical protein
VTTRWEERAANERATMDVLIALGNETLEFGVGQLSVRARQLQQLDEQWPPDLNRWLVDNMVRTKTGELVYVDAKFRLPGRQNYSIEMRSLMAAKLQTRPVWYVFSRLTTPGTFVEFRAIDSVSVFNEYKACCIGCAINAFSWPVHVANGKLARYCPRQQRGDASGTPYVVVPHDAFGWRRTNPFGLPPVEMYVESLA